MAEQKMRQTTESVADFLASVEDAGKRADCRKIAAMMRRATGRRAKMWGASIVGYGQYHYKYASGREGDWFECGYSPRTQNIAIYIMPGFKPFTTLMSKLGKHRTGKSCLYVKRLADVDETVLENLVHESVAEMRRRYPR